MSSAKAVGKTTKQKTTEDSEEDRQKKELAKALFGGMQRSMVMSKVSVSLLLSPNHIKCRLA